MLRLQLILLHPDCFNVQYLVLQKSWPSIALRIQALTYKAHNFLTSDWQGFYAQKAA